MEIVNKAIKGMILAAAILASPALAEESSYTDPWALGLIGAGIAVGGGFLIASAVKDADDEEDRKLRECEESRSNDLFRSSCFILSENPLDVSPVKSVVGGMGVLLGLGIVYAALNQPSYTDGLYLDYRGNGNFMVAKTWEL